MVSAAPTAFASKSADRIGNAHFRIRFIIGSFTHQPIEKVYPVLDQSGITSYSFLD
jgi:hypothetical protein